MIPLAVSSQLGPTQIYFGAGPSFNGSGDDVGLTITNEIQIPIARRIFLNPGIQFTRHAGGSYNFSDYRYVLSGVSLHVDINYALLEKARHRIALGVGPYVRHQINSDGAFSYSNNGQGIEVTRLEYFGPMKTFSVGYHISPSYYFVLSNKLTGAFRLAIQNDTRGDIISSSNLMIGVKL